MNAFIPLLTGKDLTTISETSESHSSRASSHVTSPMKERTENTTPVMTDQPREESAEQDRSSPEVQILDITDLNDPGVRIISKFSFKDPDNKFHIKIYGK